MSDIFFERSKNYEIKDNKEVKVTKYKNGEIEVIGAKVKNNNLQTYKKINKDEYVNTITGEIKQYNTSEYKTKESIKRAMNKLRKILKNNFFGEKNELYITLTCEENITNYDIVHKKAESIFNTIKKEYGVEYVYVMEQQERECWHIHAMIKGTENKTLYINNEDICKMWELGYTKTERIKTEQDCENIIEYITKTEEQKGKVPSGKKAYYKSRGIKKAKTEIMEYKEFKEEIGETATKESTTALHIRSTHTGNIVNTHIKETWREDKHNERD